ncbi:MAG: cysteine desulfurase [Candidatus Micrarchaeia archaeon]
MYDVDKIINDFPILKRKINGRRLVYLDSAATSQKPIEVINAIVKYYRSYNANIHRGIYKIAEEATSAYTDSKEKLAKFINASGYDEIVYTRNTTESINLVAKTWGESNIGKGDHILISEMEHHSNIVPWQVLAKAKGAKLDYVKLTSDKSALDYSSLEENLEKSPKLVAITHVSNVLGTINDVKKITRLAHKSGAIVLIDGAQSAPHMKVDVASIGCDFFALSGHKMLGPTGIGALYAKRELLEEMPPFITGGDMIKTVNYESATWNDLPWKFEAGTSNIEGGIGLGAAIDYINSIGISDIEAHERELTEYALKRIEEEQDVNVFGPGISKIEEKGGIIAFDLPGIHPHDVATIFDKDNIAIRAGHHCAMPLVLSLVHNSAVSRMSFYLYNTSDDVDAAINAIHKVKKLFGKRQIKYRG